MQLGWYGILILAGALGGLWPASLVHPAPGDDRFAGRWEIGLELPNGTVRPYAIVEIDTSGPSPAGRILSVSTPDGGAMTVESLSIDREWLHFTLDNGNRSRFRGRRVEDRLEGTGEIGSAMVDWIAIPTSRDSLEPAADGEVVREFDEALQLRDPEERTEALREFLGRHPDTTLRGPARFWMARSVPDPGRRRAALERFLSDFPGTPLRDDASFEIAMTVRDYDGRIEALRAFIEEFPYSPWSESAFIQVFGDALRESPPDEPELVSLIDGFLAGLDTPGTGSPGGPMRRRRAEFANSIAERLLAEGVLVGKAEELNREATASIDGDTPARTAAAFLTTQGKVLYRRDDLQGAEESFRRAVGAAPGEVDGSVHVTLGKIRESRKDWGGAIEDYLRAFATRPGPEVLTVLEPAWRRVHGDLAGLHERIDEALLAKPRAFEPGHYERDAEPGRVVLAELFTGAECRPCQAADLAFEGLLERYDRATVAVLAYHLHIPGPDPLANEDSEMRGSYYAVSGTPTVVIDGTERHTGGGLASGARRNFEAYTQMIEERAGLRAPVAIRGLATELRQDVVTVHGEVRRDPETARGGARLHLALVEEIVHYTGANGIHFHHFVVRKMLGAAEGRALPPGEARTPFSESIRLADLEAALEGYLSRFEERFPGFRFRERPHRIDRAQLGVVAFVQDEETAEILQSSYALTQQ